MDSDQNEILRKIEVDSAVTRERVESLCDTIDTVQEKQVEQDEKLATTRKRLTKTQSVAKGNRKIMLGAGSLVAAATIGLYEHILTIL